MGLEWLLAGAGFLGYEALARRSAREMDSLSDIEADPMVNFSVGVQLLANAIARAEGFGPMGTIPTRAHNPGDLALGDIGYGTLGAENITVFGSDADGWQALYKQLALIESGQSHVYTPAMTIADMAAHYAPGEQAVNWAANVAGILGVSTSARLADIFGVTA